MLCYSLLACRVSIEESADSLMRVSLNIICHSPPVVFNILSLIFTIFDYYMSWCVSLGVILPGTLHFLDFIHYFIPMLQNFSAIISSNMFLGPFSLSSPSGTPIMRMLVCLMLSQKSLRPPSIMWQWYLPSSPPGHLSVLRPQLFCYWFLLVYLLFISDCLFFDSSRSLGNISCVSSIFPSILFPRSWIIFTVIILNSFSGRLLCCYLHFIVFLGFYLGPSCGQNPLLWHPG